MIAGRIRGELWADRDLLGAQGERTALTYARRFSTQHVHFAELGNLETHGFSADRPHLCVEDVAGSDEVGDEAILGKAVDSGWLVQLLDAAVVHHCNPM